MGLVDNFKRDIARHRGRSAVLGVLFVTMIAFSIRAVVQLRSAQAVLAVPAALQPAPLESKATGNDTQARLKESQDLWGKLREVKFGAASTNVAFTFDPALYPPPPQDLTHKPAVPDADLAKTPIPTPQPQVLVDPEAAHRSRILEQLHGLVLKSTAVGDGIAQPVAIINQKLLTTGQVINGFTITAIRSREVEVVKEGVTGVITMPDGQ
jgi:hypothetical protein